MRRLVPRWQIAIAFAVSVVALAPRASAEAWNQTVLYRFAGGSDGAYPYDELIQDGAGNLFGTTFGGGAMCAKNHGCGTVFKLAPDGTETVLYAFRGGEDGGEPRAGLVEDQDGNLYGTTTLLHGTVFKLTQGGAHTVLHTFAGKDGTEPIAGLISDQAGNLYGTAASGGDLHCYCGTVFRITPAGVFSVLYAFHGASDGNGPQGALVADSSGNLYGTTYLGGDVACNANRGCGTVFKLTPDGQKSVLHAFHGGQDGMFPFSALIFDAAGDLYGTTGFGGGTGCDGLGCGSVFKLAPDGAETILARFEFPGAPTFPHAGVIMDDKGNLFGTGPWGGVGGCGGVFRVAVGKGAKTIHSFTCRGKGRNPGGGVLRERGGLLVGTTIGGGNLHGTVFALQRR